jgi:hypothetical protein
MMEGACKCVRAVPLCPSPCCRATNLALDYRARAGHFERAYSAMWDVRMAQVVSFPQDGGPPHGGGVHSGPAPLAPAATTVAGCMESSEAMPAFRRCVSRWSPMHVVVGKC